MEFEELLLLLPIIAYSLVLAIGVVVIRIFRILKQLKNKEKRSSEFSDSRVLTEVECQKIRRNARRIIDILEKIQSGEYKSIIAIKNDTQIIPRYAEKILETLDNDN